jgi:hypothetical protein
MGGRIAAVATQRPRKAGTSSPPGRSARAELLVTAEDRGFEPRRAARPNRISSAFPLVTGRSGNDRDRPGWQVSRAGKAGIVPGPAGNAERVRTRNGHTPGADAGHRGSASMAGSVPAMRSIVVRAMPASRCTSLLRRPPRSRPGRPGRAGYRPRRARRPRRPASAWPAGPSARSRFARYAFAARPAIGERPRSPGGGLPGPATVAAGTAPGAAQGRRLAARRACRTRTGTSPAIVIRRGRHHLPQPAKSRPPFSCSSACRLNPVIRFAISRRQVTMTDCDEQPVIGSLQSAPAESDANRKGEAWLSGPLRMSIYGRSVSRLCQWRKRRRRRCAQSKSEQPSSKNTNGSTWLSLARVMGPGCCHGKGTAWRHE